MIKNKKCRYGCSHAFSNTPHAQAASARQPYLSAFSPQPSSFLFTNDLTNDTTGGDAFRVFEGVGELFEFPTCHSKRLTFVPPAGDGMLDLA